MIVVIVGPFTRISARSRPGLGRNGPCGSPYGGLHQALSCFKFTRLRKSRSLSRQKAAPSSYSTPNEPSGIWQTSKILSWLDPGIMAFPGDSLDPEPDSPALDYIMGYPAPAEDDPDDPEYAAAAASLKGPDMHAPLEPIDAAAGIAMRAGGRGRGSSGWGHATSLIEQLRQKAVSGSSSEGDEEGGERDWQSMDIPALLLSPHHADALHSFSSEEDTSAIPDFADMALAREADRAAQAAAELVPLELRPLARAANLLGFHQQQQQVRGSCRRGALDQAGVQRDSAPEPADVPLEANRFLGFCEPLTDEQLEAVAILVAAAEGANGMVSTAAAAGTEATTDPPAANPGGAAAAAAVIGGSGGKLKVMAAAAAALLDEGVEWLDAPRSANHQHLGATMDLEDRSVQLRRAPCTAAAERGMEGLVRTRVAAEAAHELAEAEAHVVHHGGGVAASGPMETHGSE
ncbi:hypothetical protein Vretimale_3979 [Volvox reticuliferus]|uniref:Uncharacterized protein n=1 Tax=Volvox reticuliferus TaxID=1737510 RepID=A0A8J4G270_9CHLO|nr:hypothetical protein Vretimale_3979 [Volvox reticuliferus]